MLKKLVYGGLWLLSASAWAEVYVWTDTAGERHYSDRPQHNATQLAIDPGVAHYWVDKVFDGDTVLLSDGRKVRLLGINTPEVAGGFKAAEPGGEEAKTWLTSVLAHQKVSIVGDVEKRDHYQRTLAYIFDQRQRNINVELVRRGLAVVSIYPPNLKYLDELLAAERQAEAERQGIWANPYYAARHFQQLNQDNYRGWQRLTGKVLAIKHSRKYSYLLFSDDVQLQVPDEYQQWFPDLDSYKGKQLEARGWIHRAKQRYSLLIRHPGELKLLD